MTLRSGAQLLVDQLRVHGVQRAFCVPGESYLAVLDALHDAPEIALVVNRHESGSSFMADAYAKLTGQPGVAFVTRGPGATNAAIGVHTARQDSTPMVLFIGQVGNDFVEREAFQEIDYRRMFGPMAKLVAQIDRAERVPELIAHAFQTATSGRPGPVVLALPEDMLAARAEGRDALPYSPVQAQPGAAQLEQLRALLASAQRPLAILGGFGWTRAACGAFARWALASGLPVACAFRFQDLCDNRLPNYVGDVGIGINPKLAARVKEADLILAIGPRLGEMTTSGYTLLEVPVPKQTLVHVHPGIEELGRVYQPRLAIASGLAEFAQALAATAPIADAPWRGATAQARAEYEAWQVRPPVYASGTAQLDLWQAMQDAQRLLPADTIVTNGAGNFSAWAHRFWRYTGLRTQLAPTSGAMGYGVPAGIAASLTAPERTVLTLAGDGDFLMTGQELATAVQYGAAPIVLVFNNGMYGTIRMHQEREFPGRVVGTALANPDFAALARAYGCAGVRVERSEDFAPALQVALCHTRQARRPALIELICDPEISTPNKTLTALRSGT
ncbi:MAG: thiamine pyrophosphate-binding protein [Betaproteobacteria bacterium]